MIWLDPRTGSAELLPTFNRLHAGVDVCVAPIQLDAGDIVFEGNGPGDSDITVAIERKRLRDMLGCMRSNRFTDHQLPGLTSGAFGLAWLVLEGVYRAEPHTGVLQEWRGKSNGWCDLVLGGKAKGRFMASELDRHMITLQTHTGLKIWRTRGAEDTCTFAVDLYRQLHDKRWDEHKSHLGLQLPSVVAPVDFVPKQLQTPEHKARAVGMRMAMCLPGMGHTRAQAATEKFRSVVDMVQAGEKDWVEVEGVGKGIAQGVVDTLRRTW